MASKAVATCWTSCTARRSTPMPAASGCKELGKNYQPKVPYPNSPLANHLKLAAQLIERRPGRPALLRANRRLRHARQPGDHARQSAGPALRSDDSLLQGHGQSGAQGPRPHDDVLRVRPAGPTRTAAAAPTTARRRRCSWSAARSSPASIGAHPSLTDLAFGNLQAPHRFPPGLRRRAGELAGRAEQGSPRRPLPAGGHLGVVDGWQLSVYVRSTVPTGANTLARPLRPLPTDNCQCAIRLDDAAGSRWP